MENKFKEGQMVHAKIHPEQKLVIRRYIDTIYYCTIQNNPTLKELVYFERELESDSDESSYIEPH